VFGKKVKPFFKMFYKPYFGLKNYLNVFNDFDMSILKIKKYYFNIFLIKNYFKKSK